MENMFLNATHKDIFNMVENSYELFNEAIERNDALKMQSIENYKIMKTLFTYYVGHLVSSDTKEDSI